VVARQARAAIVATHPDLPGRWCGLSAELAIHAGDAGDAALLLLTLGRRAVGSGALTTAAAVLDQAATFAPPSTEIGRVIAGLRVEVAALTGDVDRAFTIGRALVARIENPAERAGAPAARRSGNHGDLLDRRPTAARPGTNDDTRSGHTGPGRRVGRERPPRLC
jgi:hypothetical protein